MYQIVRLQFGRLHKNLSGRLIANSGFCSDSGKPKDENEKKDPKPKDDAQDPKSAALKRLNELLGMMNTNDDVELVKRVQLAQPKSSRREKKKPKEKRDESDSDSDDERPTDLVKATRKVATSLGGDVKKTEAELLGKLLASSQSTGSLNEVITGMQIDKEGVKKDGPTRSKLVRKSIAQKAVAGQGDYVKSPKRTRPTPPTMPDTKRVSVKLFDEEPLNIFTDPAALEESSDILKTWKKLQDREVRLAGTHPPANYFQKMALWTEQGKLWKFPIDNEQGLDAEAKVSFTEHIFLDEHLEPWCPSRGPIRHFMELVCVGLSKNHYLTAQEKKEHILWYKDYFEQKKDLLQQVIEQQKQDVPQNQIEK